MQNLGEESLFMHRSCLILTLFICLLISGCKIERSSSATPKQGLSSSSENRSMESYKNAVTPRAKRVYSNLESETLIRRWLSAADSSLIIVDSAAPEWLPSELERLKARKPYLNIQLASKHLIDAPGYQFIPSLKASYILIDYQYLVLNPLYSSTDHGLSYVTDDLMIVEDYLRFSQSLFSTLR